MGEAEDKFEGENRDVGVVEGEVEGETMLRCVNLWDESKSKGEAEDEADGPIPKFPLRGNYQKVRQPAFIVSPLTYAVYFGLCIVNAH